MAGAGSSAQLRGHVADLQFRQAEPAQALGRHPQAAGPGRLEHQHPVREPEAVILGRGQRPQGHVRGQHRFATAGLGQRQDGKGQIYDLQID